MQIAVFLASVLIGAATLAQSGSQSFDVVIVNGRVIDGTGASSRLTSVGIRSGVIAHVGGVAEYGDAEVIDANGSVVAPGLIAVLPMGPRAAELPGVTTVVAGAWGTSVTDIADSLERLEAEGTAVNYATLIGHNTLRLFTMGRIDRSPTVTELQRMKALVFRAMADGAFGFSTALGDVPGRYADEPEVVELARVSANEDGVYSAYVPSDEVEAVEAVRQAIKIGAVTRMPVRIFRPVSATTDPSRATRSANVLIEGARRIGLDVGVVSGRASAEPFTLFAQAHSVAGAVTLEELVRRVTSLPAQQYALKGRGEIRVGVAADLIVFDPARLRARSSLSHVVVNGVVTVRQGVAVGVRVGQVLRHHR